MPHQHVPALDGVRGIALLTVFAVHTHPNILVGGHVGVDLFFVLSGFLITSILLNEFGKRKAIDFRRFYIRRALRLLPALVAMVLFTLAYVAVTDPENLAGAMRDARSIVLYYYNWRRAIDIVQPTGDLHDWFGHLWSLSVEEQFYIVWPVVLVLALRARSQVWFGAVLLAGIVGPALARFLLWEEGPSLWLYFRTDLRFDNLMWGAAAAWLLWRGQLAPIMQHQVFGLTALGATAAFFVIAYYPVVNNGFVYVGGWSLVGLTSAVMIIAAATNPPQPLKAVLEWPFLIWTGKISYGLYIWHIPVFYSAFKLPVNEYVQSVVAVAVTYLVAAASFYMLERPFLRLKDKLDRNPSARNVAAE